MTNVITVARYILDKLGSSSIIKIHRLCFYCQALSLVSNNEPLFYEDFEAWESGPICPELFDIIYSDDIENYNFTDKQIEIIGIIINQYGNKPTDWLRDVLCLEDPWKNAYTKEYKAIITKDSMRKYYSKVGAI